jgi:hypothetical protein
MAMVDVATNANAHALSLVNPVELTQAPYYDWREATSRLRGELTCRP